MRLPYYLRLLALLGAGIPIAAGAGTSYNLGSTPARLSIDGAPRGDENVGATVNLYVDAGQAFIESRPFGGTFFTSAGAFQGGSMPNADGDPSGVPTSNLSLKLLAPYLGTYLGVGWKGSETNNRFKWMVTLGIVRPYSPTVAMNIMQADSGGMSDNRTNIHYRLSLHSGFSLRMQF